MGSKIPWIVAMLLAVAFAGSAFFLIQSNQIRRDAEADRAEAIASKKIAEEAAAKALAAREEAETSKQLLEDAKKKSDSDLAAARTELAVAKGQETEKKNQTPGLEAELAAARKSLAEVQRLNPGIAIPKVEAAKIAPRPIVVRHAEGGWSVPEMLPPETLGLITVRDVPTTVAKAKETGIYKILTHPDVERVFRKQTGQARGLIFAGEMMAQTKLADLLSFVSQGEITFAVLGVDKRLPTGQPLADLMLSIQLREKAPAFVDEFNKRIDQLKAATGGRLEYSQSKLGATTITRLKFQDFPGELSCGLCDGTFLICLGEGRLEKLMAMHEKMKTAQKADGAPEVLAQVPAFKKALEKAGADADVIAYVNIEAGIKKKKKKKKKTRFSTTRTKR